VRDDYPQKVKKAIDALLSGRGDALPSVRQAAEGYAAKLSGGERPDRDLPEELADYLKKVALHAYETTDDDMAALKAAGYSEDVIFEITLCAAMGAGLARLERGLAALKGEE
jgi:hypothetical protein